MTRAKRPIGVGASLLDFAATASADPNFSAAWDSVQTQLITESGLDPSALQAQASAAGQSIIDVFQAQGGDVSTLNSAKLALTDSYEQLSAQSFGLSGDDIVGAAKAYVIAGKTVVGAIGTVQGLIQGGVGPITPAVVQSFTGTLIGVAVAAGATSAGIGAAIVLAVGAILKVMEAAGLFGKPGEHFDFYLDPGNGFGGVGINAIVPNPIQVSPGSVDWRHFPEPSTPEDAQWFQTGASEFQWHGLSINVHAENPILGYQAWGEYDWISGDASGITSYPQLPPTVASTSDFQKAFFAAYKANKSYVFNGLKAQSDDQVLVHTIRVWNTSHEGPPVRLEESAQTFVTTTGLGLLLSYANSLVTAVYGWIQATDPIVDMSQSVRALLVNSGPLKSVAVAGSVQGTVQVVLGSAVYANGGKTTTAAKKAVAVAVAAPAIGVLGVAAYSIVMGKSVNVVLSKTWEKLAGTIGQVFKEFEKGFKR